MLPPSKTEVVPYGGRNYLKATYLEPEHRIEAYDEWELSAKIDGVRIIVSEKDNRVTTRNGEEVLPEIAMAARMSGSNDYELFAGSWSDSISVLRGTKPFTPSMLYSIQQGNVDSRLQMGKAKMTYAQAMQIMNTLVQRGIEGLVMRHGCIWLKVVPVHTADVRITGFKEGTGRNKGRLGSIETTYGNAGSGLDDGMRTLIWANRDKLLGKIVEVQYRETYASGKFRFPRFVRLRLDKDTESI